MPSLQFKGKVFVQNHHLVVPFHELTPVKSRGLSKKASVHDNLIIEGDNLAALKALLPTYHGKVKCIYIDPPYNTGNEKWAYNDNVNSPMMQEWLSKVVDREDLTRHDKWCCMMMPRLKLLRELLRDDGAIFVSIDDNEVHRLRSLMDEVFGEENFVGTIVWQNVTDNNPTNISKEHEYIACYARSRERLEPVWKSAVLPIKQKLIDLGNELKAKIPNLAERQADYTQWFRENKAYLWPFDRYKYIDDHGIFTGSQSVHNPGREGYRYDVIHPRTKKPCQEPLMGYRFPPATMDQLLADRRILFGEDETKIIELKLYVHEYDAKLASVFELDTRIGSYEIDEIFPEKKRAFDYPKPTPLIKELVSFATARDSIVLDSFAGSGTTAQAVLALNKQDGGTRQFVLCQMPFETKEQEQNKENICDRITAERVRRVIRGVPEARDENLRDGLGGTFSYFKLGKPLRLRAILEGSALPDYESLASYVFFTATGEEFDTKKIDKKTWFIGESRHYDVFLLYESNAEKLKQLALTLDVARSLPSVSGKPKLVFAPTKYLDPYFLDSLRITFQQLPYQIYKALET